MKLYLPYKLIPIVLLAGCSVAASSLHEPLPSASLRATPLYFGLHVTPDPAKNPISPPERFSGFHAATDFEVSSGEVDGDVPVYALCPGKVRFSGYAEGYGGLLVHECTINKQPVTVMYGHLKRENLPKEGARVTRGQTLALLAKHRTYDSGANRKHLHLAIHKGNSLDIRGYVQNESDLENFIDPQILLAKAFLDLPIESPGETPYWQELKEAKDENVADTKTQ